ncbi:MAG: O-antigen ligase family protein [Clostridia bacterium]|nr:O-antigen ligase family protein [Clostridia bacterium]
MAKNKTAGHTRDSSQSSLLLNLMHRGLSKLKNLLKKSVILQLFSSYDTIEEYAADSFLVRTCRGIKNNIRKRFAKKPRRELGTELISPNEVGIFAPSTLPRSVKNRVGEAVEESMVLGKVKSILHGLLRVPMMSYGVFLFSFGLFTTVMQALLYFLLRSSEGAALDLFVGLLLILLSLPIMFKGYEPMIDHFGDSIVGNLMFRVFRDTSATRTGSKASQPTFLFFLAGMVIGLLTYFAPPILLLLLIAFVAAALCVLYVPETGVCLILFLFPFFTGVPHASILCAGAILYTGVCMLLKVMVGRRSISFGLMDGVVLLFGLIVLSTGLAGGDNVLHSGLLYAAMISGYFTLSNLLRNPSWIKRSMAALTLSSFLVTVTGLLDYFLNFGVRIALLADPSVATIYLLTVTVPALAMMLKAERARGRMMYLITVAANITYLLLLGSPVGICALCVELLVFFLFYTRKTWTALLLTVLLLPWISYFVWPDFRALADQLLLSGRMELWRALGGVFADAPLSGVGMSDHVLLSAISANSTADLSLSNTWLRLLVQVGIPGLMVFLVFVLLWFASGFTLLRRHCVQERHVCFHLAIMASLTGLLIAGGVSYLWSDNRMLLLFWMMAGIGRALQRIAKRNAEAEVEPPEDSYQDGVQCADMELTFTAVADQQTNGKDDAI